MSQTVETQFGIGTVVDRDSVRGRVSYKVEGPGFSTWIEASALPMDFQWMPGPEDIQDNSVTLPYNPAPQTWTNPAEQNIQPNQRINPKKRTAPSDSVDFQEESESYTPGPDPSLFATAGLSPEDIQAKLGPKYVNAFVEHDFTSLQARIDENPSLVMSEYRERVAELVAAADEGYLTRVGRNEYLEASDPQLREAAWKDVRAKAVRLRRSGQVNVQAANPDVIASQVTGDHGTYECLVVRSNIFQGNSAVDSWSCECPWGQWAFKREHRFVGRLCSHAYASLLELQALSKMKRPGPRFRNAPAFTGSRTAQVNWVESPSGGFSAHFYDGQHIEIFPDGSYEVTGGGFLDAGQAASVEEAKEEALYRLQNFFATKQAEIVDLRPVGWDPYSRNLMNRLHDLWEEGSRPGRQKERNEEIRDLVTELRERGFATDGIMASLKEGFIDSPMGYDDLPDYGTSEDYIRSHELHKREDVFEPQFEYTPGTDDGKVLDINDGGGEKTADYESGDEYGGDENPYYVDPAEQEDWDDPLPDDASEEDIVANFQRNAGWLMGGGSESEGSSGGGFDFADAAAAHLRTAGRSFTMAEQQALIDEDDGQIYDAKNLDLRGTHYL